jgi:predicted XRE-type DNA-binding protein
LKSNEEKNEIKNETQLQWQIAEFMAVSESSLSRKMRHELSEEDKRAILPTIKK